MAEAADERLALRKLGRRLREVHEELAQYDALVSRCAVDALRRIATTASIRAIARLAGFATGFCTVWDSVARLHDIGKGSLIGKQPLTAPQPVRRFQAAPAGEWESLVASNRPGLGDGFFAHLETRIKASHVRSGT